MGMHPLFVIAIGRKAIALLVVGTQWYAHFVGRKTIMKYLARRRKPHATSLNGFKGRMARRLP